MANVIKVKRSTGTATPASLNDGELAFSFLSGKLFVGNSTAVIPIAGTHVPGTLTANQALVANSTSGINQVIVANLVPTAVYANGAFGTSGQLLTSNSTGGVFWSAPAVTSIDGLSDVTISSVANNQLLVYDNTSGQWENHSVSGNSNQVSVAFASQDITVSLAQSVVIDTGLSVGNSSVNTAITSSSVTTNAAVLAGSVAVGANVTANTTALFIGNSTVNTVVTSTSVASNVATLTGSVTVGANLTVNTSALLIGNSTVNTVITSASITSNAATLVGSVTVGNSSVNTAITSSTVTSNAAVIAGSVAVGANVTANTTALFIGNSTVNTVVTSTTITTNTATLTGSVTVGANLIVNTSTLSIGNTTVNTIVNSSAIAVGGVISSGNNTITGFINVSSTANVGGATTLRSTLVVNGAVTIANTLGTGNTTVTGDLSVTGNTTLGDASTDSITLNAKVASNVIPSANNTYNLGATGSAWNYVYSNNVTAVTGSFQDVTVSGNLTISGTLTSIDTVNLTIKDPLIKLANNNIADAVDIGFYGTFNDGATKYLSLFRDQSDAGKFKLYTGLTNEPGTTVDLTGGSLGTFVVGAIEATSLTLSSVLTVPYGGTGAGTFTSKGIMYGNGTSALQVTAAGTDGQVLQANSTGYPVFSDLDGGTF